MATGSPACLAGITAALDHMPASPGLQRLAALRQRNHPATVTAASEAAFSLGVQAENATLEALLASADSDVRLSIMCTLMTINRAGTQELCRTRIQREGDEASACCLAMTGQQQDSALLSRLASAPDAAAAIVDAVGILGDASSVPLLLHLLRSPRDEIKAAAGRSLALMSGAGFVEMATVTSAGGDFDEDEPVTAERAATSPDAWEPWWRDAYDSMHGAWRWRRGRPFDLGACIAEMADEGSGRRQRERAHQELIVLSGASIPFSTRWFVARQDAALAAWSAWWNGSARSA